MTTQREVLGRYLGKVEREIKLLTIKSQDWRKKHKNQPNLGIERTLQNKQKEHTQITVKLAKLK